MELPTAFETFMQSGTAPLSNTVCIVNDGEEWSGLSPESVNKLAAYGEVARVDSSLDSVLGCLLVTYFDVRSAQKALMELSGKAEAFRQGDHDFRVVIVNTAAYAAKVGISGGFNQFGEVANVSIHHGDAIVEYYDLRSAQRLIALAGNCATPCSPKVQAWPESSRLCRHVAGFIDYAMASQRSDAPQQPQQPQQQPHQQQKQQQQQQQHQQQLQLQQLQKMQLPPSWLSSMPPTPSTSAGTLTVPQALSTNTLPAIEDPASSSEAHSVSSGQQSQSRPPSPVERSFSKQSSSDLKAIQSQSSNNLAPNSTSAPNAKGSGPIRTKISNKDFAKFDINTDKIMRGEDSRTTVMVRNLVGTKARKDFLKFLERANLHNRFTFFYMPCKEHRDVRAGFAFVNFKSAEDVKTLYGYVKSDMWKEMRKGDPQCKPLAMSYARFQGHEELMTHFSSSVVMHEQDPEKRPLFCAEAPDGHFTTNYQSRGDKGHGKKGNAHTSSQQGDQEVHAPPGLGFGQSHGLTSMRQPGLSGAVQELLALNDMNMPGNDDSMQSVLAALQPWAVPMEDNVNFGSFNKGMHSGMSMDDSSFQAEPAYIPDMACDSILGGSYPVSVVGRNYGV
mmetsp:Transcript_67734/g.141579  ORF Transcript_67734/g.141579 Transcript_67734/m.141579 type:complete len:616 (-) Transcript_67734:362-2209(-)|eukprot:CAMPEP_0206457924 /NCGR_PEP_ID=MMETSP0324_2-20121206/23256_1 /ASSEMBLY_ACC=CAM_ASM_000836 /TAXON_ID=2866 /ORGANISM="Crypthecodinium cohnii, Strain Seligo" /LENGTH=615 /DNA_ID=CAMNT_0053929149 /DNA_START=89 /DNA_END=1936 /DNA_ORIENTATION=-